MATNILLAGATGNLGHLIAQNLLQKENVKVYALVRNSESEKAVALAKAGAEIIQANLKDKAALALATREKHIVLSALSGGPEVVVEGQLNLLEAAVRNRVQRFIPSDYSIDYFKLAYGDNVFLDYRKLMFESVQKSGIGYTVFLTGIFTEIFLSNFFRTVDLEKGTINFWGSGNQRFDVTTLPDIAKFIADAVLDIRTLNRIIHISGNEISMNEVADILSAQMGKPFRKISNGTDAELKNLIEELKAKDPNDVFEYVFYQYKRPMYNGVGKLTQPVNKHYDGSSFTSLAEFIASQEEQYAYQF